MGSRERLCSPSCLALPEKVIQGGIAFPRGVFPPQGLSSPCCTAGAATAASWCPGQSPPRGLPPLCIPRSIWHRSCTATGASSSREAPLF